MKLFKDLWLRKLRVLLVLVLIAMLYMAPNCAADATDILPKIGNMVPSKVKALVNKYLRRGDATWYDTGLGACGWTNQGTELVAALSYKLYDKFTKGGNPNNNSKCGKYLDVYNPRDGKAVRVKIVDKCMGCSENSVDLSKAAFEKLNGLGTGRFPMLWRFV
ncbi:Non-catalytic module expn protein [Dimargaris verticillata]|uniref:Non-catalytic module expn protein n=1 Tax=Dimargaris verticillata TaxID=2761393 RepID=A0A9W8B606_9FUNG|nr:Non-catalytic module expn protein [Dimargaris verticillata]